MILKFEFLLFYMKFCIMKVAYSDPVKIPMTRKKLREEPDFPFKSPGTCSGAKEKLVEAR